MGGRKVRAGEDFKLSAKTWNRFVDASDLVLGNGSPDEARESLPCLYMNGKNTHGSLDMNRGDAGGIEDVLFTEADNAAEFRETPSLKVKPIAFANAFDRIAIALEPIPVGKFGRFAIAGCCIANVDVTNAGKVACLPQSTGGALVVSGIGSVKILHRPSGTGVKKCLVLIGDVQGIVAKTKTGGIPAATAAGASPGSATCDIYFWTGASWADSGFDHTIFNMATQAVEQNVLIQAKPFVGEIFQVDWEMCPA